MAKSWRGVAQCTVRALRKAKAAMHSRPALSSLVLVLLAACNLDGLLLTELSRGDNRPMPEPAPQTVAGEVTGGAGAAMSVLGADGKALAGVQATAAAKGEFALTLPGDVGLANSLISARLGGKHWLALVPSLPPQASVLAPARQVRIDALSPGALQVDDVTTAMSLLVVAKLRAMGQGLPGAAQSGVSDTLIELHKKITAADADPALLQVVAAVARVRSQAPAAATVSEGSWDIAGSGSLLRTALVAGHAIDLDGDGAADPTTAKFDALVAAALGAFSFKACYVPDRIRVVLQTRFVAAGGKNANCDATFDPYLWTNKADGKMVFVTGGIHKDSQMCSGAVGPTCLTQAQVDAANAVLGNWVPNQARMYDDGTHGDAAAGDGTWTLALELPYIEPADGVAPVRIAYKFTYGKPAQGWTDSEEFPGNQRLLELVDVNGDRIVTRFDLFADETTNKDKKNGNDQGCGEVHWVGVDKKGCLHDVRERKVDLDGDCIVDAWPNPGTAGPLAIPCAKGAP